MGRLISWAVGFTFRTLWRCFLLGWMVVRFLLPFAIRVMRFVGGLLMRLTTLSVLSLFIGVPTTIRRMAASWTGRALASGIPVEHELTVFRILTVVAFAVLLSGWAVIIAAVWLMWTRVLSYM